LYCTDTAATGFAWKGQEAQQANFKPDRYTVKIVSETQRIITRMAGDTAGRAENFQCERLVYGAAQKIACTRYDTPWVFTGLTYVRALLSRDDGNIVVAYGACAKF
jgi:hypothetical protein